MSRRVHLHTTGNGLAARTACGRPAIRTPISCDWAGFQGLDLSQRCARCNESKRATVNTHRDRLAALEHCFSRRVMTISNHYHERHARAWSATWGLGVRGSLNPDRLLDAGYCLDRLE